MAGKLERGSVDHGGWLEEGNKERGQRVNLYPY